MPTVSGKRNLATLLRELQKYKVSHPIVFALLHRFMAETDSEERRKVGRLAARSMKNLASFVMRTAFVSTKFEPSRFEAAFANCAKIVFDSIDLGSLDILAELAQTDEAGIIDDGSFVRRMTDAVFLPSNNAKALRYLFGINAQQQKGSDVLREDRCSVEHVLPQSRMYWNGWKAFENVDPEDWIYRTGNLVVVSQNENQAESNFNGDFSTKRRALRESALSMPRRVAKGYNTWTPDLAGRGKSALRATEYDLGKVSADCCADAAGASSE